MKLISMHVDDFGGLHNYDYSFEEGLNVVLHDNGWGKTTMAAFLKAMLYGYDTRRSKDITENERKRYLPWQGGKYGGSLDFEADGVSYRIIRTFGETPRFDTARIINLATKTTARIPPDKIGETLFHLDANAFQRSVFINQNGLSIDGAASSIHARLNALVSQANDVAAYDGALTSLTQQIKVFEKTGARGQIGTLSRQIEEKERARNQLERDIAEQDAARERISQIDTLLSTINRELEEKGKKLDALSGEAKKREAAKKLLEGISEQIKDLQAKIDSLKSDLGGSVPSSAEIDRVKQNVQTADDLKNRIETLQKAVSQFTASYNDLLNRYDGNVPAVSQLDKIQSIYSEVQGVQSSGADEVADTTPPEEYETIKSAINEDSEFVEKLQKAIGSQTIIEKLIHELESLSRDLRNEAEIWKEKTSRFAGYEADIERLQRILKEQGRFSPEAVEQVIARLEELQRKQQAIEVKRDSLTSEPLTQEQENLLCDNAGELPDRFEAIIVRQKQRENEKRKAEIQGLTARLEGEKSKEESLSTSLVQLETVASLDAPEPKEPGKSYGAAMIGFGAVIAVIGMVLGFIIMPALFALATGGALLAILGVVSKKGYKKKVQEYKALQESFAKKQDAVQKRDELLNQLQLVQSSISDLEHQIEENRSELMTDEAVISAWFAKWAPDEEDHADTVISQILEKSDEIRSLRERKAKITAGLASVEEQTAAVTSVRESIDISYPECSGKTIQDALNCLRAKQSAYTVSFNQLQTVIQGEDRFIAEAGISREAFAASDSPKAAKLRASMDEITDALQQRIDEVNKVLTVLGLDTDAEHIIRALREAEAMLHEYSYYSNKLMERSARQKKKQQQMETLLCKLAEALSPISSRYAELEIPERLAKIREEIGEAGRIKAKIKDTEEDIERQRKRLVVAEATTAAFVNTYGHFPVDDSDLLPGIYERARKHAEMMAAMQELEKQRKAVGLKQQAEAADTEDLAEGSLLSEVNRLKERRDSLLIEYTQKSDFIRHADQSLEEYPDTIQEIHELYEQKQKALSTLAILKRSMQLITKAKENLANRYLSKVEELFNRYLRIWLNNDTVKGILDIDFNVSIEENGKKHVAEGYSTGYCDLIDFCMRLALVDTLFEKEQPFLILDDPFVNLDADRLEKALELLNVMAANKQVVYFVCHPIRAVETEITSAAREEFLQLANATRAQIAERQASGSSRSRLVRKTPKELYRIIEPSVALPFRPTKPNYTITNSIFSLSFELTEQGFVKDGSYELFFIDAVGHVLNDRQIIEVDKGKLSTQRVQFSLNTRDDSGDLFELMIRESGQDDYDVVARLPFRAKLAFAGTINFGF